METWLIAIIALCATAAAIFILLFIFAAISYKFGFGIRCDKNPFLKYFTAEDFNLDAKEISFPVKGITVRGYIYRKEEKESNNKLIIFCHGMGAGHLAYTTEIAYFCNNGFTVLAVDYAGCNLSDGKNIRGMYSGVQTAVAAYDFACGDDCFKDMKIYFVGHSWGGYSALCAAAERKAEGVVAISAPNTPVKTIYEGAAQMISKPFAAVLCPFWYLINLFKFGAKGNSDAAKCATKNGTSTLLIHGDRDNVVPRKKAAFYSAEGENITKYLAEGKAHDPHNTVAAEQKLAELLAAFKRKDLSGEERRRFFDNFDFNAATEEDEEVMQTIINFLK